MPTRPAPEPAAATGEPTAVRPAWRLDASRVAAWLAPFREPALALGLGFAVGALIIAVTARATWQALGAEPLAAPLRGLEVAGAAYLALLRASLGSPQAVSETLVQATPLILVGLAVAVSFQARLFNIGGQGQMLAGALLATVVGTRLVGLPGVIHLPLALAAAFLGGALAGFVPGYLKARSGAHEVITTIMMNFVAINLVDLALGSPLLQRAGRLDPISDVIAPSAALPTLGDLRVHAGLLIALAAASLAAVVVARTTVGFEMRVAGSNPRAAAAAGMNVPRLQLLVLVASGGLAGLGGAVNLLGVQRTLAPDFAGSYGLDAVTVAILGRRSPLGVVLAALFLGALKAGAVGMQAATAVAPDIIVIVQAVALVFMTSSHLVRSLLRRPAGEARADVTIATSWAG